MIFHRKCIHEPTSKIPLVGIVYAACYSISEDSKHVTGTQCRHSDKPFLMLTKPEMFYRTFISSTPMGLQNNHGHDNDYEFCHLFNFY